MVANRILIFDGRIAELSKAKKVCRCNECGPLSIGKGDTYWKVTAGKGLSDLKFPDRICVMCFPGYKQKNS